MGTIFLDISGLIGTTKAVQPTHIDPALQAMIDRSLQPSTGATSQPSSIGAPTLSTSTGFKGSYASSSAVATPFPDSTEDVNMESSADKRSRESPDSTLIPEGKSLKTSGVATATSTEEVSSNKCTTDDATVTGSSEAVPEAPAHRWKARSAAETKQFVRLMHHRTSRMEAKAMY